ncbi:MAG TPA: exosortase/archaeosortase family protein [Opitutaceae bacterium]|nr:exosortase/archaeosortase family protein [Lacunisphaera sp.]HWA10476.1 exosortase/archaeosortase family protein [Opitutaceae bacterium]
MTSRTPDPVRTPAGTAGASGSGLPALAAALAGAVVFQFYGNANHGYIDTSSLFRWWTYQWVNPGSETEHGWLILGLSAWLFWRNLRLADRDGKPDEEPASRNLRLAGLALVGGLGLHLLGFAVQQARLSIVALLVFSWGVLALAGGRRWRRAGFFPLAFMVFAIPLNVLDSIGFWLQLGVIKASAALAHAAGIGVLRNGTQLLAPDGRYQYDVVAACSGVRSLVALAALALLVGWLNFRPSWLRAMIFLLCFPLVYLGNVARITSIVFAAQWGGQAWGDWVHEWLGFIVFAIVLGGLLLAVSVLRRVVPARWQREDADDFFPARKRESVTPLAPARTAGLGVAVVLLAAVEMLGLARLAALPPGGAAGVRLTADGRNPVELPTFLGTQWIGRESEVTAVERSILPPDTGFSRKLYVPLDSPSRPVFLSIVLSGRDRTSIHRPELCLVGQGWTIDDSIRQTFKSPLAPGGEFSATLLRVRREAATAHGRVSVPQLVAYWFVGSDAIVASHWQRFAHDAWNRVAHLRADRWAYVLMQTDATDGEAAALARLQAVLDRTLPAFAKDEGRRMN